MLPLKQKFICTNTWEVAKLVQTSGAHCEDHKKGVWTSCLVSAVYKPHLMPMSTSSSHFRQVSPAASKVNAPSHHVFYILCRQDFPSIKWLNIDCSLSLCFVRSLGQPSPLPLVIPMEYYHEFWDPNLTLRVEVAGRVSSYLRRVAITCILIGGEK